jgi:hypothetical protein
MAAIGAVSRWRKGAISPWYRTATKVVAWNCQVRGKGLSKKLGGAARSGPFHFFVIDAHALVRITITGANELSLLPTSKPLPAALPPHHAQTFFNRQRSHLQEGTDLRTAQ